MRQRPVKDSDFVALASLAQQLAIAPHRLRLLPRPPFRGLFVVTAHPHLTVQTLALHLLLQRAQRLIDIVVANLDFHETALSLLMAPTQKRPSPPGADRPLFIASTVRAWEGFLASRALP